jgi:ribonuclease R
VYRLGDPVRVRVLRVDLDERKIDLELVETSRAERTAKTGAGRGGRRRVRRLR